MITVKNEFLTVSLDTVGAELVSVLDNQTQKEYIWQGKPSIWNGHSPILFPIAGRLRDDSYIYKYKTYSLPKHGFARRSEFSVMHKKNDYAVLAFSDNDKTRAVYPFSFYLSAEYRLVDRKLQITHKVYNRGNDTMYFSLGAHPAFNLEIGGKVVFSEKEPLTTLLTDEYGLVVGKKSLASDSDTIVIDEHIFDADALFFDHMKSTSAKLVTKDGEEVLRMTYGDVPYLGLWAKPNAPYVCIEPWFGICDHYGVSGKIEEKPAIIPLEPRREFIFSYEIEFF
ncbi:MAG: aldose 1-epimerase family protein [Clostridia bacterium]|nr:aldose 1-epimerase family protein [Clostridia bacterium]